MNGYKEGKISFQEAHFAFITLGYEVANDLLKYEYVKNMLTVLLSEPVAFSQPTSVALYSGTEYNSPSIANNQSTFFGQNDVQMLPSQQGSTHTNPPQINS